MVPGAGSVLCSNCACAMRSAAWTPVSCTGQEVEAVFGFCSIRNFTDATDVLKEKAHLRMLVRVVSESLSYLACDHLFGTVGTLLKSVKAVGCDFHDFPSVDNAFTHLPKACPCRTRWQPEVLAILH